MFLSDDICIILYKDVCHAPSKIVVTMFTGHLPKSSGICLHQSGPICVNSQLAQMVAACLVEYVLLSGSEKSCYKLGNTKELVDSLIFSYFRFAACLVSKTI